MRKLFYDTLSGVVPDRLIPVLLAQAAHETGGFSSKIFVDNFNLFGMKHPEIRPTFSYGDTNGYATYETYQDSIMDIVVWLRYNSIDLHRFEDVRDCRKAIKDYVSGIKAKSYFEADLNDYSNAVVNWFREINL